MAENANVHMNVSRNEFCFSDHNAIMFDLSIKVKYKSISKRSIYNFDKGDYIALGPAKS